jgi:uncharacterized protein with PQ loop repeat
LESSFGVSIGLGLGFNGVSNVLFLGRTFLNEINISLSKLDQKEKKKKKSNFHSFWVTKIGMFIWGLIFGYNKVSFEILTVFRQMLDFWQNELECDKNI